MVHLFLSSYYRPASRHRVHGTDLAHYALKLNDTSDALREEHTLQVEYNENYLPRNICFSEHSELVGGVSEVDEG